MNTSGIPKKSPIYSQFADDPDLGGIVVDYVERLLPERLAAVEQSAADCDLETLQEKSTA